MSNNSDTYNLLFESKGAGELVDEILRINDSIKKLQATNKNLIKPSKRASLAAGEIKSFETQRRGATEELTRRMSAKPYQEVGGRTGITKQNVEDLKLYRKALEDLSRAQTKLAASTRKTATANTAATAKTKAATVAQNKAAAAAAKLAVQQKKAAIAASRHAIALKMMNTQALKPLYMNFIGLRSAITSAMVFVATFVGAALGIKAFADAANEAASAMAGLNVVLKATKRESVGVNRVVEQSLDYGISMAESTATLRNLMLMQNVSTKEAITLYWNLVAAAMANTKAQYPLGKQIQKTSEGLRDLRSQASDAVGIGKNLDIMILDFARSLGVSTAALTFEMKQRGAALGFMAETEKFLALLTDKKLENVRAAMGLGAQWRQLKIELGNFLLPLTKEMIATFRSLIDRTRKYMEINKLTIKEALQPYIKSAKEMVTLFYTGALAILKIIPRLLTLAKAYLFVRLGVVGLIKILGTLWVTIAAISRGITLLGVATAIASGNIPGVIAGFAGLAFAGAAIYEIDSAMKGVNAQLEEMDAGAKTASLSLSQLQTETAAAVSQSGVRRTATASPTGATQVNQFFYDDNSLRGTIEDGIAGTLSARNNNEALWMKDKLDRENMSRMTQVA